MFQVCMMCTVYFLFCLQCMMGNSLYLPGHTSIFQIIYSFSGIAREKKHYKAAQVESYKQYLLGTTKIFPYISTA